MVIEAFAPSRIDLAGGTLDIHPLYVFEDGGLTLNLAINLLSYVRLETRDDSTFRFYSKDLSVEEEAKNLAELPLEGPFDLITRAVKFYKPSTGLNIITKNSVPKGSGLGASSSLLMALSGALNKVTGKNYSKTEIIDTGANIEAQSLKIPTGKQDYYAAVFGGLNALWFNLDGVIVCPLLKNDRALKELEEMIVLSFTGESRFSGTNNWEMTKRYIDNKGTTVENIRNIKKTAEKMRKAIAEKNFREMALLVEEEWKNRTCLAEGVSTDKIEKLIYSAKDAGSLGSKICGAGGGGCMITLTEPEYKENVVSALKNAGAEILDFSVDTEGLRIFERN